MINDTISMEIPFESLIKSVKSLSLEDKHRLWELLEKQLAEAEEEIGDQDPTVQKEIKEARKAYRDGDYITLDDYIAQCHKKEK